MAIVDYTDRDGVSRRVELKTEHENPAKGIPLDVYYILDEFFEGTNEEFRIALYKRLYNAGLVEAKDFTHRDARKKIRQALQATLSRDATDIIRYIQEIAL